MRITGSPLYGRCPMGAFPPESLGSLKDRGKAAKGHRHPRQVIPLFLPAAVGKHSSGSDGESGQAGIVSQFPLSWP